MEASSGVQEGTQVDVKRQLAMVMNLDKCIGCQGCTVACRTHWLDRPGAEQLYYIWCETKPGEGWPKGWMDMGRHVPDWVKDYGGTWSFNLEEVYGSPARKTHLHAVAKETGEPVSWGPVWDEDEGGGEWPNGYFFYMPRLCNHCSDPLCVAACASFCERKGQPVAMRKREEDGIVVIDPDACDECGVCVAHCPYKIPLRNITAGAYEMCDFCAPRLEHNYAPVCAKSCPARAMYFGYLDDGDSFVSKLVNEYEVALPLRPDFGTRPNVYYVPPFIRPKRFGADGKLTKEADIPVELLRTYFGPKVDDALTTLAEHRERAERGEPSELMDALIIYKWGDAFEPFSVLAPEEPTGVPAGQTPIDEVISDE